MGQQDMQKAVKELGGQVADLLSEHVGDILKGYEAAGEEPLVLSIRATLTGNLDEVKRKVALSFVTEKVTGVSVDKTMLRQTALGFVDEEETAPAEVV